VIPDTSKQNPIFEQFIKELRTDATRVAYRYAAHWVLDDQPDAFLRLARQRRRRAEQQLIDFIVAHQKEVASSTLMNPIRAVKAFLKDQEALLNWKRIEKKGPVPNKVANDRYPTHEEIRKLLAVCDLKMSAVALLLASSGMRVGAFDFLTVRDATFEKNGLLRLVVYRGEPEEYTTFASTEAAGALKVYLESREKVGEKLGPESPLIRDKWNYDDLLRRKKRSEVPPGEALQTTSKAIKNQLGLLWIKARVRELNHDRRHEFQQAHGFRKFFKTQASKSASVEMVERLKGKKVNYFKPSIEEVEAAYLEAMPNLLVSEKYALQEQAQRQDQEHSAKWQEARLETLELKAAYKELQEKMKEMETKPRMTREEVRKMFEDEFQRMTQKADS
jgi:integrase